MFSGLQLENKKNLIGLVISPCIVAIGNPERHVRKASHRGSRQQQRSPDEITLLLPVRATHIYFCSSRTSRSW